MADACTLQVLGVGEIACKGLSQVWRDDREEWRVQSHDMQELHVRVLLALSRTVLGKGTYVHFYLCALPNAFNAERTFRAYAVDVSAIHMNKNSLDL